MNPQATTDMPPQRDPAIRSLRSVHDPTPYVASRQHQRRLTHTNCTTEPKAGKSGSPGGQRCGRPCRWSAWPDRSPQVAAELDVTWHTVMDAVPDGA